MPKKENAVICINNENHTMIREEINFAIPTMGKDRAPDGSFKMQLGSGIPLTIFRCHDCNYVEFYHNPDPLNENIENKQ